MSTDRVKFIVVRGKVYSNALNGGSREGKEGGGDKEGGTTPNFWGPDTRRTSYS